jgi:peptidoglycan/LPS O-acetylase OafA/YrhL
MGTESDLVSKELRSSPRVHEFDGLRAILVYVVLMYHTQNQSFSGGFIGVDGFFVLSGFFISSLLLNEFDKHKSINFSEFYARRMRRLLPAVWFNIVLSTLALLLFYPTNHLHDAMAAARAALLWIANWHFVLQGWDYFRFGEELNPFLHYWSLSVEEQFYIVWPALVLLVSIGAFRIGRLRTFILLGFGAAVVLLGIVVAVLRYRENPVVGYFATEARIYQLALGFCVAVVVRSGFFSKLKALKNQEMLSTTIIFLSLGAFGVLVSDFFKMSTGWRGLIASLLFSLIITLLNLPNSRVTKRLLGNNFVAYLGTISYGTYLWHLPVIVILNYALNIQLGTYLFAVLAFSIATAIAAFSYKLIEMPVRKNLWLDVRPKLTILLGIMISAVLAFSIVPVVDATAKSERYRNLRPIAFSESEILEAKRDGGKAPVCSGSKWEDCILVDSGSDSTRIVLMGDSHARSLIKTFENIAEENQLTLLVLSGSGCPWQFGMLFPRSWGPQTDECRDLQKIWYNQILPEYEPDFVFVESYSFDDVNGKVDVRAASDSDKDLSQRELAFKSIGKSKDAIIAAGGTMVIVEPFGVAGKGKNPVSCLASGKDINECRFKVGQISEATKFYRSLAQSDENVFTVNLNLIVCKEYPWCDAVSNGMITHRDHNHVRSEYLYSLRSEIWNEIKNSVPNL